jgi:prepilin-type N-terminal cleavage/methylation domain-containing protein
MRIQAGKQLRGDAPTRAFTLVELMVVIVIIALLIGMLVPAVTAVRTGATVAATKAALATLETGLTTFKAESRLGGDYPPSFSDQLNGSSAYAKVRHPYAQLPGWSGPSQTQYMDISGAGLLVWALVGADKLGTPGFTSFRSTSTTRLWSDDSDDTVGGSNDPTQSGAYALRTDTQLPIQPRSGPYVDTSRMRMSEWNRAGKFEIKAETEANPASTALRQYPMFLDGFGFPILYWRADPAGVLLADQYRKNIPIPPPPKRGIYHWEDNSALFDTTSNDRLVLRPGATQHRLWMKQQDTQGVTYSQLPTRYADFAFPIYIWDQTVQAKLAPQRTDTFLLVSPGPDGIYGSGDDVTNFRPNGR